METTPRDGDIIGVEKKEAGTDYVKTAKALGEIIKSGINVSLIDINKSAYGFKPDVKNNQILYGLKALSGVNKEAIDKIIKNHPYKNMDDFMKRCKLNKTAMISLIKAGAFDNLWNKDFIEKINVHPRIVAMVHYLKKECNPKSKLTLSNMNGLIQAGLIPYELEMEKKTYLLNKLLKKNKMNEYYWFNSPKEIEFYNNYFDPNSLEAIDGVVVIKQKVWDNIYDSIMDHIREWLKAHHDEVLQEYNDILFKEIWEKYGQGNISSWEMDSVCFYHGDHELKNINNKKYGIVDFNKLNVVPAVERTFKRNGKQIPLFVLTKIAGTVIGKNDNKHSISLLTTTGVVTVKFTKDYYALFGRQISEVQADGTKKVKEKGWFTKGTMLLVTGFRRDDMFIGKTYSTTAGHQLYKITKVNGSDIELTHNRYGQEDE